MAIDLSYSEEQTLDWNAQGAGRRGRPTPTWKSAVLMEEGKYVRTISELKRLPGNRVRWRWFSNAACS
jgi:hypothetical protein